MTRIPWTDETWEIVQGCTMVSVGCMECYAERLAKTRLRRFYPEGFGKVVLRQDQMEKPLRWRRPRMVFPCSRSDLFHPNVPSRYLGEAVGCMAQAYWHTFQVLTKRADRLAEFSRGLAHYPKGDTTQRPVLGWPPNVWKGVSVENQKWAERRLPLLAQVHAKVRFVSLEPLLGPVDLGWWLMPHDEHKRPGLKPAIETVCGGSYRMLDWVIVGGESGPNHRPMEVQWLVDVVAQCKEAGVPVFVKQDSGPRPGMQGRIPDDLWAIKEWPETE